MRRDVDFWFVRCGPHRATSKSLDAALIEALRTDHDFEVHAHKVDYPGWVRAHAAMIEAQLA